MTVKIIMRCIVFVLVIPLITGCTPSSEAKEGTTEITISAASSMTESLLEIKDSFEREYPHIKLTFNFGGSGSLRKQIEQGAPIDLFFSASKKDYTLLEDEGMVKNGGAILENDLVIIKSDRSSIHSFEDYLQQDDPMAIGTPEAVPAGTYAKEALEEMGLWESLQDRLIFTKDVQQVETLVNERAVDVGIVYLSDIKDSQSISVLEEIDPSFHSPIEYFLGIIQNGSESSGKKKAIETFYDYVQTEYAMELFERYGFQPIKQVNE